MEAYKDWYALADENPEPDDLYIQFVGISTVLISDGKTSILTDGFFSRPYSFDLLFGRISPEKEEIAKGLEKLGAKKIDALFVLHSHFDHAMDAPEVARLSNCKMYGSPSTANIARGWGLAEEQIITFENGKEYQIGDFKITPILSKHYEFTNESLKEQALGGVQEITQPLVPPVVAQAYKMGGAYSLLLSHPKGNLLVHGSAGYLKDGFTKYKIDKVILGIGGLGRQTEAYQSEYFEELLDNTKAKEIYLVHWDSFVGSVFSSNQAPTLFEDWVMFDTHAAMKAVQREMEKRKEKKYYLLPQWEKVVLFD